MSLREWAGPDEDLGRYIGEQTRRTLKAYREQPNIVQRDANQEEDIAHGGYQHRQLVELVQNSADQLWFDDSEQRNDDNVPKRNRGRIEVRLTEGCFYCADDGYSFHIDGVRALMFRPWSPKRRTDQIGTFGLGFGAVLGVSDTPEIYSQSGSFQFDRTRALERIREVVPEAEQCPVLPLPEPIDPTERWNHDGVLRDLMTWAVNIVRLPLRPGTRDSLLRQMSEFPAELLLFVPHVRSLALVDDLGSLKSSLALERVDKQYQLTEGDKKTRWCRFKKTHPLSSDARANRRRGDDRDDVCISWAVPVDRLSQSNGFWTYFPTQTQRGLYRIVPNSALSWGNGGCHTL